ncbi:MAG: DUF2130 domain-containing protein [Actinomycetota bacterium]|nr:DUF2130 domain-containing protein [Actinomycetota bacterium]
MEASEKPQLPLELERGDGSVRLVGDRIVIEAMTIADEGTARVVRDRAAEGQTPAATVRKSVEIGARVLESEGAAANVDFVNAQFERHMGSLAQGLAQQLESGSEELAERIAAAFGADRSDSVQQQIRELLVKANEHQRTELVRLFNAEDGANPLADFKVSVTSKVAEAAQRSERQAEALRETHTREAKELRDQIAALTTQLARLTERSDGAERLAEAEEAGTRKGRSFEEKVHDSLALLADGRGDAAFHVGDEPGKGGSKKGDTVVEIDAAHGTPLGRIVFEAKDRQLSKNRAWEELNAAMGEREAAFAVLVIAGEEHVPAGREQLHEYEGNKLIVAVDAEDPGELGLDLAYRYARCRLLMQHEGELEMDAPAVRDAAGEALSALKQAQSIKLHLTKASDGVLAAREGVELLAADVRERLERIERLVAAAAEEAED